MTSIPMWLGFAVFVLLTACIVALKREIHRLHVSLDDRIFKTRTSAREGYWELRRNHEALADALGMNFVPSATIQPRYVRKGGPEKGTRNG